MKLGQLDLGPAKKRETPLVLPPMDTRKECLAAVAAIKAKLHDRFPDALARLEQLDSHLETVAMIVEHIHDEAERAK